MNISKASGCVGANVVVGLLAIGLLSVVSPQRASAAAYPYSVANGDWGIASNWNADGGDAPPSSPTNDVAFIGGGYDISYSSSDNYSVLEVDIGRASTDPGLGTLTMTGGSLHIGSGNFNVGASRGATVNQSGGTISVAGICYLGQYYVNSGDSISYALSGSGALGMTGNLDIGYLQQANNLSGCSAIFTQSGTTSVTVGGNINIGCIETGGSSYNYTYNLNGGTVDLAGVINTNSYGTRNFYFNGGLLQYTGNTAQSSFMSGLTDAYVSSGGAFINSGTQSITISQALLANPSSTGGGLTASGSGNLILAGNNTYTGGTTVSSGTLQIGSGSTAGAFGSGSVTDNGTLVFNRNDNYGGTLGNAIGGSGALALSSGTLTLAANNGFTGAVAVSGGKLYLNGSNAASSITVASGATLGGSGSAASAAVSVANGGTLDLSKNTGSTFTAASLTFGGGGTIDVNDSSAQYAATPAISVTSLSTSSTINLFVGNVPTGTGTMQILQYSGAIGGSGSSVFNLASPVGSGRSTYALVSASAGGSNYIDLSYFVDYPFWTGAGNLSWDTSSTNNWALNSTSASTTFETNDNVVFDDRAIAYSGTAQVVNINAANVSPLSVTFSNSAASYTLQGSCGITGSATLAVNGAGSVTIANANSYTGGTTLTSGVLNASAAYALGAGPVSVLGGTLNTNAAYALGNGPISVPGGVLNAGATLATGTGALTVSGGTLNAYFVQSPSSLTLSSGAINANAPGALGSGTLLQSGGLFTAIYSQSFSAVTLSGGTLQLGNGTNGDDGSLASNVTDNGTLVYNLYGNQSVGYSISGTGNIVKLGQGILTFDGQQPFTGAIAVGGGTLATAANYQSMLASGSTLTINSGGVLQENYVNALMGGHTAAVTVNAGGQLAITANVCSGIYGPLTLAGGTLSASGYLDTTGDGSWDLANNVTVNGGSNGSTMSAPYMYLKVSPVNFNVAPGAASGIDLLVSGFFGNNSNALTKSGSGVMVLTAANQYTGATTISGGVLQLGNSGPAGSLSTGSAIVDNATLAFNRSNTVTQGTDFTGSAISGTGGIVQQGTGALVLNAANTYTGPTTISSGTLSAASIAVSGGASNLGNAASPIALGGSTSPATFIYTGSSANFSRGFTINSGGGQIITANSAQTLTIGTADITGSGALVIGGAGSTTVTSGVDSGISSCTASSSGTVVLAGNNSYSGSTSVTSGKLYLNGTDATTSISLATGTTLGGIGTAAYAAANVANATTLDFSQNTGSTFALSSLTFAGGSTINMGSLANYASSPVVSVGALSTSGAIGIDANLGSVAILAGTYDLIAYSGSIGGSGSSVFSLTVGGLGSRQQATLVTNSNQIEAVVSGVTPFWNGNSADWLAAGAWTLKPGNTLANFQAGDSDVFDDTASSGNVSLNIGNVSPASVAFNNTYLPYTLSGSYGITGSAALAVNGGGAVTLSNSNGYSGGTTLANGLLNLANSAAIGTGPLTITGGMLDNTSGSPMTLAANNAQNWNGNFTFLGSNPLNTGTGTVTLGASPTVFVSTGTLSIGGPISGAGALTKNGGGTLVLAASSSYAGGTTLVNGVLDLNNNCALGTGALSINGGAIDSTVAGVTLANNPQAWNADFTFLGSNPLNMGAGAVSLGSSRNITVASNTLTIGGVISGGYPLTIYGGGTLLLTASNTYSGVTTITSGTLQLGDGTSGHDGALSSGVIDYATLVYDLNGSQSVGYNISGAGSFVKLGPGTVSLTTGQSFTGSYYVNCGIFTPNAGTNIDTLASGASVVVNSGGTVQVNETNTLMGGHDVPVTINAGGLMAATGSICVGLYGPLTLAGGTLSASGYLDTVNGSWDLAQSVTVSGGTNTSVISAPYVDLTQPGGVTFTVNPGTANGADLLVSGFFGSGGSGILIKAGAGGMVLTGSNLYTGATTISGGTLQLGDGTSGHDGSINGTSGVTNDAALVYNLYGNQSASYGISGGGSVAKLGSGMLTLSGNNSYFGGTYVGGGTLQLGSNTALGNGGLTANAGVVDLNGQYYPAIASLSGSAGVITNSSNYPVTLSVNQFIATTFSGTFQDGASSVGLSLNGGTLTLLGNNTNSGATSITNAALIAGAANTLSPSSAVTLNSSLLDVTAGSQTIATLYASNNSTLNLTVGNLLTITGNSYFSGETVLNVLGTTTSSSVELIALPGGYSGSFTAGILPLGYSVSYNPNEMEIDLIQALANSAAWNVATSGSWTVGSNWSTGTSPTGVGAIALLGTAATSPTTISLDSPQTVGTLTFANSAGYTLTAGSAGSLTMDNTGGTGDAQILVLSGSHSIAASLTLAGTNTAISVISGGSLDISGNILDGSGGSSAITFSSSDGTGLLTLDGSNSFAGGLNVPSGTLVLNGAAALLAGSSLTIGSAPGSGDVFIPPSALASRAASPSLAPVPEPGTLSLVGVVGLWSAIACYRFSKRPVSLKSRDS